MSENTTGTGTTTPAVPPMPTAPPTVGTKKKGVKGALDVFQKTYGTGKTKTKQARTKVAAATAPARKKTQDISTAVAASATGKWSFFWSAGIAWTLPVTFPVALLDRIALIFGSPRPLSGTERMDWNLLHGIGPWFGDQIQAYSGAGEAHRMFLLAAAGAGPIAFAQLKEKIPSDGARKFLGWLAYGFPSLFILGKWYFDHWDLGPFSALGFHTTSDLYLTALFALSWWGFTFSRTIKPGFWQMVLRIPVAALIIGFGLNAPGAAF